MFNKDHSVGTGEGEPEPTNVCRQQQAVDTGVRIERLHDSVTLGGVGTAVQTHIGDGRHMWLEQILLDNVQHLLHLTEDKDTMLRHRGARIVRLQEFGFTEVEVGASS